MSAPLPPTSQDAALAAHPPVQPQPGPPVILQVIATNDGTDGVLIPASTASIEAERDPTGNTVVTITLTAPLAPQGNLSLFDLSYWDKYSLEFRYLDTAQQTVRSEILHLHPGTGVHYTRPYALAGEPFVEKLLIKTVIPSKKA